MAPIEVVQYLYGSLACAFVKIRCLQVDICSHRQKNFHSIYNASIPRIVKYITLENTARLTILCICRK